MTIKRWSGL